MRIQYIRHTQHLAGPDEVFYEHLGLSETGVDEASRLGEIIDGKDAYDKIISFDHLRAFGTISLALGLDTEVDSKPVEMLRSHPGFEINNTFNYIDPGEDEFGIRLYSAYLNDRNFEFLANFSDQYFTRDKPISSLTFMAASIAQDILSRKIDKNILICAREFLLPSLRALLIKLDESESEMFKYVDWYSNNKEAKDQARTEVTSISVGDAITLQDSYGLTHHSIQDFEELSGQIRGI
jgi:hypothetical protein